jgi:cell division transport system permease protein
MSAYKRAMADIRDNRLLTTVTVVTMALAVLIVGSFALVVVNAGDLVHAWKRGIRMMVYLGEPISAKQIDGLQTKIGTISGVASCRFIPKAEALKRLKAQLKGQSSLFENLTENPLPDAFEVHINPQFSGAVSLATVAKALGSLAGVADVEYGQQWMGRFSDIFELVRLIGSGLGGLLFLAAVFFVASTIRLVLYSRREEIEIMRLVGATDRFITLPFYLQAIMQGGIGAVLGLVALFAAFRWITTSMSMGTLVSFWTLRFLPPEVMAGIVSCSMATGWLGCYVSLKPFCRA